MMADTVRPSSDVIMSEAPALPFNDARPQLPPELATIAPQVNRTAKEQEIFDHRKSEILKKFTLEQIKALHAEEVAKTLQMLEDDRRHDEEIKKQIEILEKQRELERKIYYNLKGGKPKKKEGEEKKIESTAPINGLGIITAQDDTTAKPRTEEGEINDTDSKREDGEIKESDAKKEEGEIDEVKKDDGDDVKMSGAS